MSHLHRCHVSDQDRYTARRRDHRLADVVAGMNQTDAAHDCRLRADVDGLTADVHVTVVQRLQYLGQRQPLLLQTLLVHRDVVRSGLPSPPGHIDDAGHRLETPLEHPVLERLQIRDRVAWRPHETIAVDLSYRARRRDLRLSRIGERRQLRQPIDDPLLGLLVREVISELDLHIR